MAKTNEPYWVSGEMLPRDLGAMIKRIRTELLKLSLEELSKAIDVKADTIKSCEKGNGAHIYNTLMKVCRKFNLKTICQIKSE